MRRLLRFLRQYKLFSLALFTIFVGLALELTHHQKIAHWLLSVVAILELVMLLKSMWDDFRSGRYGIDILAATAIIASVILGQYWAAIVIVVMLTGGEALEDFAQHRARSELDALLKHAPHKANVLRKGKIVRVTVEEIHVGDKLMIKAGEVVPVDSTIIEGVASFDESSLTGESMPETKEIGDMLLSGSVNIDGPVTAKATATAQDSQYQQIISLVRSASANQAPFVRLADRYAVPFTFLAFAIASAAWLVSGDAIRFLEVIVVATPCPLLLAAPIAVISGMARASRYGIIVKTGLALERMAEAKTIAFDKTGTLTKGIPNVDKVITSGTHNQQEVLSLAASLEQNSNHIIAHAVVEAAKAQNLKYQKAKHVKEISGLGLQAQVKGKQVLVGRLSLLIDRGVNLPANFKAEKINKTVVYVAIDGSLAGIITMTDELRPESAATLERLQDLGIKDILMVTGDNKAAAEAIATKVGITQVYAETLPADKLHVIDEVENRPLIFVGDGVNDAPVLTAADVGVALGARGSTAASESADMVIMLDDFSRVATATEISKRTFGIARQSILIGIGLSLILMVVFSTGKFTALSGAIIQEGVDVFVIFNALRAHLIKPSGLG